MWDDLLAAIALMLVIEGLMPFLSPRMMRSTMEQVTRMPDINLRIIGLASMVGGALMLWFVRS
ncbi:MAG: DUF2065 domain-containing protein [Pseudomonadota bacterium]|nr:DUF2065 domain-containing protein [Pseudomonadota bacterium]